MSETDDNALIGPSIVGLDREAIRALTLSSQVSGRLSGVRALRGKTQQQLAKEIGKSRTTVAQYETGAVAPPLAAIEQIAKALKIEPSLLAFGYPPWASVNKDSASAAKADGAEVDLDGNSALWEKLEVEPGNGGIFELPAEAPEFGLSRGDLLFVDTSTKNILGDGRLYAIRSSGGDLNLARTDIALDGSSDKLRITLGRGQATEISPEKIDVLGRVQATLKRV